ncbi:MAG: ATP-binding protein [Burkholderiaceae bacterium]
MSSSAAPSDPRRAGSLRLRLIAGTLAWCLAAVLAAGIVLTDLFEAHIERRFVDELRVQLDQLTALADVDEHGVLGMHRELSDPRLQKPFSGLYWQAEYGRPADDSPLAMQRSRSLWDYRLPPAAEPAPPGEIVRRRVEGPNGTRLVALERAIEPPVAGDRLLHLTVAADERGMTEPVREFIWPLALSLAVLAGGLVLAATLQVSAGLAPLRRLRRALAGIRDGRSRHIGERFPAEVQPLVDELNAVLHHDTEVVERARTQTGNLAHALKTPLAVLANAATRQQPDLATTVIEQIEIAQRQIDHYLARARAAAAAQMPGLKTPVVPVAEGLLRAMSRIHAQRSLSIEMIANPSTLPAPAFHGEQQDLQEMLGNLLDNACKWARHRVELRIQGDGPRLQITIDDDGPGLAPERREAVFARGARVDERVAGSGLGLDIVRDLARLYRGDVWLTDSPLGGLRAVLQLPAVVS